MLLPHPESDLTLNVMVLGSEIIAQLRNEKRFVVVEGVLRAFLEKDPKRNCEHFFDAVTFLFMVGIVDVEGYKIRLRKEASGNDLMTAREGKDD